MNIVYYYEPDLTFCPVKEYLNQFNSKTAKDESLLADIHSRIIFLGDQEHHPHPPISSPLRGYNFFEIKHRKTKNTVIRILYFCNSGKMILLNAFDKPDDYGSQKIKKGIEKIFDQTEFYRQKYLKNKNLYENYK